MSYPSKFGYVFGLESTNAEIDALAAIVNDKVGGPSSSTSTDNALMLWDGTSGRLAQDSSYSVNLSGDIVNGTKTVALRNNSPLSKHSFVWDSANSQLISEPNHTLAVYVSKNGNNLNDGLTPSSAKLTINAGVAILPASGTLYIGPGTYAESFSITGTTQNVTAPEAVIDGNIVLNTNGTHTFGSLVCSGGSSLSVTGAFTAKIDVKLATCSSNANFLKINGGGSAHVTAQEIDTANGNVIDETTSGIISLNFGDINISGSGNVIACVNGADVNLNGGKININTGNVFRTTGVVAANLSIVCTRLVLTNLSNITSATNANLIASSVSGALAESGLGVVKRISPTNIKTVTLVVDANTSTTGNIKSVNSDVATATNASSFRRGDGVTPGPGWLALEVGSNSSSATSAGSKIVMGNYSGACTIGAHNNLLTLWAPITLGSIGNTADTIIQGLGIPVSTTTGVAVACGVDSSSASTGSIRTTGGLGVTKSIFCGANVIAATPPTVGAHLVNLDYLNSLLYPTVYTDTIDGEHNAFNTNLRFQFRAFKIGKLIHVSFKMDPKLATSTATDVVTNITVLPVAYRPFDVSLGSGLPIIITCWFENNSYVGNRMLGTIKIYPNGNWEILQSEPVTATGNDILFMGGIQMDINQSLRLFPSVGQYEAV